MTQRLSRPTSSPRPRRPLGSRPVATAVIAGSWLHAPTPAPAAVQGSATGFVEVVGQLGGSWDAAATQGDLLVQSIGARVSVLDIADVRKPRLVGMTYLGAGMSLAELASNGQLVFGAGTGGLWTIDVSDPRRPVARLAYKVQGYGVTPGSAYAVALSGGLAFVATRTVSRSRSHAWERSTLDILDVRDPAVSRRIGQVVTYDGEELDESAIPRALAVDGDMVALLTHQPEEVTPGLEFNEQTRYSSAWCAVDVRAPSQPRLTVTQPLPRGYSVGIAVEGDRLYVTGRTDADGVGMLDAAALPTIATAALVMTYTPEASTTPSGTPATVSATATWSPSVTLTATPSATNTPLPPPPTNSAFHHRLWLPFAAAQAAAGSFAVAGSAAAP